MVELVGIEKLGTLKTDKLLISSRILQCPESLNTCNAGFIVRLLNGDFQSKQIG
jgi:hypothetical protein